MEKKSGNVYDTLEQRGFVEQVTDKEQVRSLLEKPTVCYIGFDPTAASFHAGSLLPIMSLVHMQRAGHTPIALIGGGTGLVGDPSGKTEARRIMSREEIDQNAEGLRKQLSRFLDFSDGSAIMANNADWLVKLGYIEFLRDIGRHFSVNRMLAAESYRSRLESGLTFIEFNYMLLQAYDFWHLFKHYGCRLQLGGNDQWGNILAGAELTRRLEGETIHGLTFPLLTTSGGAKMGKTHEGAIWLDPELTTPYEYYQYWINQDDRDVGRFLSLFTLLPMDEVKRLSALRGSDIREAKEILAYETTKLCHGEREADLARDASRKLFGEMTSPGMKASAKGMVEYPLNSRDLEQGIPVYILFEKAGLCNSKGEARRLISQGGGYMNDERIEEFDRLIKKQDFRDNTLILRAGKKRHVKVSIA